MNETYMQSYLKKKNIFYSDNEFKAILETNKTHHHLREILQKSSHGYYTLDELLKKKCITSASFDDLIGEIDNCLQQINLEPNLKILLNEIKDYLAEAESCIYFRDCEVDLELFISSVADKHDNEYANGDVKEQAYEVVLRCFDDLENHGFVLDDESNSMTIAEVLKMEVINYWGGLPGTMPQCTLTIYLH